MNINDRDIQNIGSIRAQQLPCGERYRLLITPPPGGLVNDLATLVEIDVAQSEVERIARVAPHLLRNWPEVPRQPLPGQRKSRQSNAPILSPKGGR